MVEEPARRLRGGGRSREVAEPAQPRRSRAEAAEAADPRTPVDGGGVPRARSSPSFEITEEELTAGAPRRPRSEDAQAGSSRSAPRHPLERACANSPRRDQAAPQAQKQAEKKRKEEKAAAGAKGPGPQGQGGRRRQGDPRAAQQVRGAEAQGTDRGWSGPAVTARRRDQRPGRPEDLQEGASPAAAAGADPPPGTAVADSYRSTSRTARSPRGRSSCPRWSPPASWPRSSTSPPRTCWGLLIQKGMMVTTNQSLPHELAEEICSDLGIDAMVASAEEVIEFEREESAEEVSARPSRAAGGDRHGPRRPRQDLAARPHPGVSGGGRRGRGHHPAHRRVSRADGRTGMIFPRHPGPRGVHPDARPRRPGDRHRHPGGGRRRRRDAADQGGHQPRAGGRVPIVVAVNKIDKPKANADRVMQQLVAERGGSRGVGGRYPVVAGLRQDRSGHRSSCSRPSCCSPEVLELKAVHEGLARGIIARGQQGQGPRHPSRPCWSSRARCPSATTSSPADMGSGARHHRR
jgi:translation initiation factor IF-2